MFDQYKSILEHIHAGVLHCKNDEYSTINYANDYFYEMIGYTREEIENNHNNRFADFVVDDVSAILVTIFEIDATLCTSSLFFSSIIVLSAPLITT